jgi:hypothetical protein
VGRRLQGLGRRHPRAPRPGRARLQPPLQGLRRPDLRRRAPALARWEEGRRAPAPPPGRRRPARARQPRRPARLRRGRGQDLHRHRRARPGPPGGLVPRPVVLVPNSIVWKWEADIRGCCPTTGSPSSARRRSSISRGERKGLVTSDTDTPAGAGREVDPLPGRRVRRGAAHLHGALPHPHERGAIRAYAEQTEAIQREVRPAPAATPPSARSSPSAEAILKEGVAAWIAEQMELPEGWDYDPGVAWDDIGVDLLMVDEAQNFKNLYLPEDREGGVPRFMGNAGEGPSAPGSSTSAAPPCAARPAARASSCSRPPRPRTARWSSTTSSSTSIHDAWSRMGIRDPEQFIDRYLRIEIKPVVTPRWRSRSAAPSSASRTSTSCAT